MCTLPPFAVKYSGRFGNFKIQFWQLILQQPQAQIIDKKFSYSQSRFDVYFSIRIKECLHFETLAT